MNWKNDPERMRLMFGSEQIGEASEASIAQNTFISAPNVHVIRLSDWGEYHLGGIFSGENKISLDGDDGFEYNG